jgi:dienelactone hydrolase
VAACRDYIQRLRAAGADVQLTEFLGAHHAYDNPLGAETPTGAKGSQSVRAWKLKEEPLGTIVNAETGQHFTYKDRMRPDGSAPWPRRGGKQATHAAVKELLRTVFKLD